MSLITSCPACGTMFRVVPDQLKISEGWVRCGHCSEVFDATANLSEEPPPSMLPEEAFAPEPPTMPAPMPTRPMPLPLRAEAPTPQPMTSPARAPTPAPAVASDPDSFFAVSQAGPDSQSLEPTSLDAPFVFRRSDLLEPDPAPSVLPPAPASPYEDVPSEYPSQVPDSTIEDVSFVRQARRKAFWRRPLVRFVLALFALVLLAALAFQYAWHERDRLALQQPGLRPALEQMCAQLHCSLGPPRQIESLVIESSGFNKLRNETYRLSFTVRNNAPVPVAAPAMELTLTDGQDQPVLRRVLTPADLGARADTIAAGGEWSGVAGITVAGNGGPRIAGYRLLAFYP